MPRLRRTNQPARRAATAAARPPLPPPLPPPTKTAQPNAPRAPAMEWNDELEALLLTELENRTDLGHRAALSDSCSQRGRYGRVLASGQQYPTLPALQHGLCRLALASAVLSLYQKAWL